MSAFRAVTALAALVLLAAGCSPSRGPVASSAIVQRASHPVAIAVHDIAPGPNTGVMFVDAMKQAGPWSSHHPLVLDDDGNVRFLAPGQAAEAVVYRGGAYPAGNYTLFYAGTGTFDFAPTGATRISGAPGRIVLHIVPRVAGLRLRLIATNPRDPVRDIRLILPGFAGHDASTPFHPLFVQALHAYKALCFKNWMHGTTFVSSAVWPSRPTVSRASQVAPAGVAPEYMVALANATGADPWFTLPVGATDMYIYAFAELVHRTLDPRLHATFEYGHEAWKPGTPGNAYAAMAGRNVKLAGDPVIAARAWYALRSTQMSTLVARAFGADSARANEALGESIAAPPPRPLSRAALERFPAATHYARNTIRAGTAVAVGIAATSQTERR